MAKPRLKTVALKASVCMWALLNLDMLQTKSVKDARLLIEVTDKLEAGFDRKKAEEIRTMHDLRLQDAQDAMKAGEATDEDTALLRTSKQTWFRNVYAEIDGAVPAVSVQISEEALEYTLKRLDEQTFDGTGRALLVAFANAIDEAPSAVEK